MPVKSPVRALPASPPLISLLTSADVVNETDNRWEAGVKYEPEICGATGIGAFNGCDPSNVSVSPGSETIEIEPIVAWAGDSCSAMGSGARDWQGRARRKLAACESRIIEDELWRGTLTRAQSPDWPNKYLAHSDVDEATTAPVDPIPALACLEQSLTECNCGAQGMIHATPQVVTHWITANLVYRDGSKLYTHLGTIVVPGSGYDGSGPGATPGATPVPPADGSIWAYATSMVHLRLGPVSVLPSETTQAMDRSTNTITYWAQRIAVVGFDCCHAGVAVDLALCAIGS